MSVESTAERLLVTVLEFGMNELPSFVSTLANWLLDKGVTPDQMHAALSRASIARQKALKAAADDEAFGEPGEDTKP